MGACWPAPQNVYLSRVPRQRYRGDVPVPARAAIASLIALLPPLVACGDRPWPATGELTVEDFHSDVVGDDYRLRIRVPPGYDPDADDPYPLVVQLDPTFARLQQYDITVGLVSDYAERGEWPEAIVVGIDYDDPFLRERDYGLADPPDEDFAGEGADRFYRMLAEELIPQLESVHAVDATRRYLLGHSNGGVFAWYAAFRHDPAIGAPLLAGAVAADNGYEEALFTYERWHHERADDLPMSIHTTRAAFNGAVQKVTFDAMMQRLRDRDYAGLTLRSEVLETDHGGAVWPSYEHGLAQLLGGDQ
jgi:enterochelin esterase-like enzyme